MEAHGIVKEFMITGQRDILMLGGGRETGSTVGKDLRRCPLFKGKRYLLEGFLWKMNVGFRMGRKSGSGVEDDLIHSPASRWEGWDETGCLWVCRARAG